MYSCLFWLLREIPSGNTPMVAYDPVMEDLLLAYEQQFIYVLIIVLISVAKANGKRKLRERNKRCLLSALLIILKIIFL